MESLWPRLGSHGSAVAAVLALCGCGSKGSSGSGGGDVSTHGPGAQIFTIGDATAPSDDAGFDPNVHMTFNDFGNPVVDEPDGGGPTVPANAPALFGPASQGAQTGGPCLIEPEPNALFPSNWMRPRFRWSAPSNANLFELRIHAANQTSDLLVYTAQTTWTMPAALWAALSTDSKDVPLTVSIRSGALAGSALGGEALGSSQPMTVAPVPAPGTIVYWTSADGTSLKQFQIGDETVGTALVPSQVQETTLGNGACFGCHTGTPDGQYSVISTNVNNWGNAVALIDPDAGAVGAAPPFLGAGAATTMTQGPLGINAVSKAHWAAGDHVVMTADGTNLVWIDLEATAANGARGTLTRSGTQTGGSAAGGPTWSHDGQTIVYVATDHLLDGRLGGSAGNPTDTGSTADLFSVPYADRAGGAVAPVTGASSSSVQEYYPTFSPDDGYLAFDECPNGLNMYNQPQAEVFVVPSHGGTATRLVANTPSACSGVASPGVTNSWPKWAPAVTSTPDGRSFYWIVFSSTRFGSSVPQLFVSGMVVHTGGGIDTYGALYLWNQPSDQGNHTPAWEFFQLPSNPGSGFPPK